MKGRVDLRGYRYIPRWFACEQTVTHPNINRSRRRSTSSLTTVTPHRHHKPISKVIFILIIVLKNRYYITKPIANYRLFHGCGTVCPLNCDSKTFASPSLGGYLRHFCSRRLGALRLLCFNGAGYKHSYLLTYLLA